MSFFWHISQSLSYSGLPTGDVPPFFSLLSHSKETEILSAVQALHSHPEKKPSRGQKTINHNLLFGQTLDTFPVCHHTPLKSVILLLDLLHGEVITLEWTFCFGLGLEIRSVLFILVNTSHILSKTVELCISGLYLLFFWPGKNFSDQSRINKTWR